MVLRKGFKRDALLFLAILGDLAQEFSYSTFRKQLYWPDYKPKSVAQSIARMAQVAEIEREIDQKGEVVVKITTKGLRLLNEAVPLRSLQKRKWDGIWRLVIFDIEEKRRRLRDQVREKLRGLGFGMWQRSVWLSPHPLMQEMNEYLRAKKLFPACVCLRGRRADFGDDKALASQVFKLEKLNQEYERVGDLIEELIWLVEDKKIKEREARKKFAQIWDLYREVLLKDPYLPFELLPRVWWARRARKEFIRLVRLIARGS